MNDAPAYGLWSLVIINSLVFIIFAFSLPNRSRHEIGARSAPSPPSWSRSSPRCTGSR